MNLFSHRPNYTNLNLHNAMLKPCKSQVLFIRIHSYNSLRIITFIILSPWKNEKPL